MSEQKTYTTYGPKGKILTVNTTAKLRTDARINWITIYNTGAITVNVVFEEATINPLPIPASTSLELDVWRNALPECANSRLLSRLVDDC